MDECAAQQNETYDWPHSLNLLLVRMMLGRIWERYRFPSLELCPGFDNEEQASEAHGTKMPAEKRFTRFEQQDDWQAPEEQNEDQQANESPEGDVRRKLPWYKLRPWNHSPEIHEGRRVE
ncbi:MAG: hypothetical protein L6R42_004400 [Xanthoria sp. 1 TBL-2021]|nr:MAG: hypothetical protein L6R42_004400 [Xanthoria sp. 1 TBL-2021]